VVLLGELLGGELVELDHFLGEDLCIFEALGEKHYLGNLAVIGDHHADGSKEDF
jgi:hypothetical protein